MANLTTLASGSSVVLTVTEQQSIVLNNGTADKARLEITTGAEAGRVVTSNHNGRRVYGPFAAGTITLYAVSGSVGYELSGDTVSPLDDDTGPLSQTEVQSVRSLVSGDGINIHPALWCDLSAANLSADDSAALDGSGNARHGVRGIALPVATMNAAAGYFATAKGSGSVQSTLDTAIHLPSINLDYNGGESALIVVAFKAALPEADESMIGNAASSSSNGFRLRIRTTGYCDVGMYSATGAVASLSGNGLTVLVDGALHQFAVFINGQTKYRSMWEDGVLTRENIAQLLTCDTRESAGLHLGATQLAPSSAANTSAISFRRVTVFRWGPTDTLPAHADITTMVQRLRNNVMRLPLQGDF